VVVAQVDEELARRAVRVVEPCIATVPRELRSPLRASFWIGDRVGFSSISGV